MKSFLNTVAGDLTARFGNNLRGVTVVFPGKRAGIFLNRELAKVSDAPVWAPEYTTMGGLFGRMTGLVAADPIDSVNTLYGIYREAVAGDGEPPLSLDKFWSWGEVILSDFDDIDKHLADAGAIFSNVYDLHRLESMDFLTEEQQATLEHFFSNFSVAGNSVVKERFLRMWSNMHAMYDTLRERQLQQGALYEGALFRRVVEKMRRDGTTLEPVTGGREAIVFAGFNVLNEVERELMKAVQATGKALFYWDYDTYYVENPGHEAGTFMRANLRDFPSALGREEFDNLSGLRDVTFISCTTDNAAARYVETWLNGAGCKGTVREETGVILCNETLMQPVIHSLPPDCGDVNVTMGFPLADTPVYSLVMALLNLQTDGYDHSRDRFRIQFVQTVRHHSFAHYLPDGDEWLRYHGQDNACLLAYLDAMLGHVGVRLYRDTPQDIYGQLYTEAVFQTSRVLRKFLQLVTDGDNPLDVNHVTLRRLLRDTLCRTSIPFHGEPALGLQVMGVLETRCLDFENMLMLSVEEDKLPRNIHADTMIPANIREAFALTTPRHRICVFSYYFYRLIQRTRHLTCVYNENCTGNVRHEMSRFLRQMLAETDIPIRTLWLRSKPHVPQADSMTVEKDEEMMTRLRQRFDAHRPGGKKQVLSPTAINTYVTCPMKFYLSVVSGIRREKDAQDGLDAPLIGDIFHDTASLVMEDIVARTGSDVIRPETLDAMLSDMDRRVGPMLDIVFDAIYFHPAERWNREETELAMLRGGERPANNYTGELLIIRRVMMQYLANLLKADRKAAPFRIIGTEKDRHFSLTVHPNGTEPVTVQTGGRIDRIDYVNGQVRVVDYKTGMHVPKVKSMDDIVPPVPGVKHEGYYLQTFLYSYAQMANMAADTRGGMAADTPVVPVLFYPSKAYSEDYSPTLYIGGEEVTDIRPLAGEFMEGLCKIVEDIFDPAKPFFQTEDTSPCKNCDFRALCGR